MKPGSPAGSVSSNALRWCEPYRSKCDPLVCLETRVTGAPLYVSFKITRGTSRKEDSLPCEFKWRDLRDRRPLPSRPDVGNG